MFLCNKECDINMAPVDLVSNLIMCCCLEASERRDNKSVPYIFLSLFWKFFFYPLPNRKKISPKSDNFFRFSEIFTAAEFSLTFWWQKKNVFLSPKSD